MLVITHYQRLLNYIVPDKVHVMVDGRSRNPAARSWRSSSRNRATPTSGQGGVMIALCHRERKACGGWKREAKMTVQYEDQGGAGARRGVRGAGAASCRAARPSPRRARPRSRKFSARSACRIGASRNGSTPTCAQPSKKRCRRPSATRPSSATGDSIVALGALARARRFRVSSSSMAPIAPSCRCCRAAAALDVSALR